ncbi:uncharacterized protein [Miscanthus floridulus]|uniref:uncharacterized protein n=1 Tax=Miscanthus floridulus TaxID=154761 RepID=UPI003459B840
MLDIATNHASSVEAVGAVFSGGRDRGKAKREDQGSYHAIFMAIPNYTYLKLKMSRLNDVITIGSTFSHAYTCDHEHYELATVVINSTELPELGHLATPVVLDCNELTSSSAFRPTEETKAVEIDPTDPTKMVRIRTKLSAK